MLYVLILKNFKLVFKYTSSKSISISLFFDSKFIKEAHDHHYNNVREIVDSIDRESKKQIVLKSNLFTDIEWIGSYLEIVEETDKTVAV